MSRTLAGKVVLTTRPIERAGGLTRRLLQAGAVPLSAPAVRIEPVRRGGPLDRAIRDAATEGFGWVVFTSAAGVDAWFDRALDLGVDARAMRARVAAVGSATAEALRDRAILPDLVPRTFTTAALGRAFPRGTGRVLLPRADIAPVELESALRAKGWQSVRVHAYRTRWPRSLPAETRAALKRGEVDAITFTSASTVRGFAKLAGVPRGTRVVCIGPVTAREARAAGFTVHAVARPHTVDGLVEAVTRALAGR